MKVADFPQIMALSTSEKLLLVEELWNEIGQKSDSLEMPEWHKRELDQSVADHARDPMEGSPWPEVKNRLLARK
jgi:putative addiction module component (TIGR02574 family)